MTLNFAFRASQAPILAYIDRRYSGMGFEALMVGEPYIATVCLSTQDGAPPSIINL